LAAKEYGLDQPVTVGPFLNGVLPRTTPYEPSTAAWTVIPAFPKLVFEGTSVIVSSPVANRLYVGSLDGQIRHFESQPGVGRSDMFLDLRDRVSVRADSGFLGIALHPDFGLSASPFRGDVYVDYTSHCPLNAEKDAVYLSACFNAYPREYEPGFAGTYLRLSRFRVPDGENAADPNSEEILLNIRQHTGRHAGGGLVFGNDRRLYLAIGEQFRFETAQEIANTLEGGTLRLSVDVLGIDDRSWTCPAGTHIPRRRFDTADQVSGRFYCIPDDNPWIDASGARFEEYFSIGQRNPYRLSKDPITGRLWSGEVGHSSREEINIVEKGKNYGWPFREGLIAGVRPPPHKR
jgi:hypothetical protein